MHTQLHPSHYLGIAFIAISWGSSYALIEIGLESLPPATLALARIGLGAAALLVVVLVKRSQFELSMGDLKVVVAAGLVGTSVPFVLLGMGQQRIDSSLAALLIASVPLFTLFLAHFLTSDERLNRIRLLGVGLGFCGVFILFSDSLDLTGAASQEQLLGQGAILVAALGYACSGILLRRVTHLPTEITSVGMLLVAIPPVMVLAFLTDDPLSLTLTTRSSLAILVLGIVQSGLTVLVWVWLVARVGATTASTSNYFIPVVGLTLGALTMGDPVTWQMLAAFGFILSGLYVTGRGGRSAR